MIGIHLIRAASVTEAASSLANCDYRSGRNTSEDRPKTQNSCMCPKVLFFGERPPTYSKNGERIPAKKSDHRVGFERTPSNLFQVVVGDGPPLLTG